MVPFSLFNIVRHDPPAVMFCAHGRHKDGGIKDSALNARETGEFVYNMATWELREQVNLTSAAVDRGVDEMALAKLETARSIRVNPVAGCGLLVACGHVSS